MEISDLHGIDISSWQRGMPSAALNSADFAILKLSEGTGWNDPAFDEFYSAATIPLGAYVYSHATTEGEAQAEAIHALSLLQNRPLPLGVYIDIEEARQLALPDLTGIVNAFCDAIQRGGYRAGAYGSLGNLWAKVNRSAIGECIVWVASWGARPSFGDVWQFTASNSIGGYAPVDGNKVLSAKFGKLIAEVPDDPQPTPEPQAEMCDVSVTMPVIHFGDRGYHVKLMQTALIAKGYNCGWMGADGDYGQQTKIALYQFQQKCDLGGDCICGKYTWAALLKG